MFIVILLISFPERELKADGEEVSACEDVGNFTWTYDDGYLFCSDNKDMVLEAYEEEESVNSGSVRMAPRTEAIAQRWRILNEYEDEDVEFRPAFAFGGHKMEKWSSWRDTKRTCKKVQTDGTDLTFSNIDIKDIEWKRPDEIARIVSETNEPPKFVVGGISRFDINQGSTIGDCWAVSVISNLASTAESHPEFLEQIFDSTQSFDDGNHKFTFKFFKNGEWQEVTVDDYLPWNTKKQRMLFNSSTDKLEFWPCLLEKAYAKFRGSYADIHYGFMSWALHDMTGVEWKEINTIEDLYYDICENLSSHGLVLAGCLTRNNVNLPSGHAYSVTGFGGDVTQGKCLRVRNPYGYEYPDSPGWSTEYDGSEANILNTKMDGEFVMKWTEFVKYIDMITVKA